MRLLERGFEAYPRAFHVVVMDALYAKDPIFNKIISHNKHFIVVLKNNKRVLMRVARMVVSEQPPTSTFETNGKVIDSWDFCRLWFPIGQFIRIVATKETKSSVRRQLDGEQREQPLSSWFWLTSLPQQFVSTQDVIEIAHSRWSIENEGFNELSNHWHADHIYKHASNAILNFWLIGMLAYNVFRAFFRRNLKAATRAGKTMLHFARIVASELYACSAMTGV